MRVKLLGIPVGVKTAGGILDQVMREVEIECLPADIPGHIDVDVSGLEMHGVLRVSDLPHSDKIKYPERRRCDRGPRGLDPRRSVQRLLRRKQPRAEASRCCSSRARSGKEGQDGAASSRAAKKPDAGAKK